MKKKMNGVQATRQQGNTTTTRHG